MVAQMDHQKAMKALLDIAASLFLLLVLGIPLACVAIAIRIDSKGPALFKQERVGKDGRVFVLYKFRSMVVANEKCNLFHNEQKVTRVGEFIRKWRIDEFPQLLNVLKGDMSLVGPRPTLPYQVKKYSKEQRGRLKVKPGVTGWSQVHGDKAISWPARIDLDLWYVKNRSFWLDVKILITTPAALLRIQSINVGEGPPPDEISELPVGDIQNEERAEN